MKKTMRTKKTLIISHLLFVTERKYFRISLCAASMFISVFSTLSSILQKRKTKLTISHLQTKNNLQTKVGKESDHKLYIICYMKILKRSQINHGFHA